MAIPPTPKANKKPVWYWLVTGVLAVALLTLALRGISWEEMGATAGRSRPEILVLVFGLTIINLFFRGIRWGILLSGENKLQPLTMFWATADGYLGNALLPARAGELIRSAIVGIKTGIGTSFVFATALTERIVDAVVLVLVGMIFLPTLPGFPDWIPTALNIMAIIGVAGLLLLILLPFIEGFIRKVMHALPLPENWKAKLSEILGRFVLGTRAFVNPIRAAGFLSLTPVIWLLDGFITVELAKAMSLVLTIPQALLLMVGLGLASALPSTPGYLGIYQFVATTILPVFGFTRSEALTFILFYQGIGILVYLLLALIGIPMLNIKPAALRQATGSQNTKKDAL
jgi:hypothetical protein